MSALRGFARDALIRVFGEKDARRLLYQVRTVLFRVRSQVDPDARRSSRAIRSMRDRHAGQRCFIIGNGPSLKDMDLAPLRNEVTFGLNRVYLMFEKLGFPTTYLVSVNRYVIEQCADDLIRFEPPPFLSWDCRRFISNRGRAIFVRPDGSPHFSKDPAVGVWEGATVTFVALQLAYWMGFQKVILIGVDHSFATNGPAHQLVTSTGDDPNHFDPAYFGKGFRWQLPDLETSEIAYRMARRAFELDGREVLDATVGGKLAVFPKVRFDDLFAPPIDPATR
jgi:hypothetical protein